MKLTLAILLSLLALSAQAAPFSEYHFTYYKIVSCDQSGNFALANFCANTKYAQFTPSGSIKGATSFVVFSPTGAAGVALQDSTTNSAATYNVENDVSKLIDPLVDQNTSLIKEMTVTKISDDSISVEFKQTASGWPTIEQNTPFAAKIVLTKNLGN